MRKMMLAILAVTTVGAATVAGSAPAAAAANYPWCLQGNILGYPGECGYQSYRQCMDSASGRTGVYCNVNPRFAFGQQPAPRRGRNYQNY